MERWDDLEAFTRDSAESDLDAMGEVDPFVVAFRAIEPLFVAYLRPFEKGAYDRPLIEVLALAAPLGADRLAVAMGGRAWSLDDPVSPVVDGVGDLRQRVLTLHGVDGLGGAPTAFGVMWPFEIAGGRVSWQEALRTGDGQGWIPRALELAVTSRGQLEASAEEVADQAVRCIELGHDLYLAPPVGQRLASHRWI